MTLQPDSILQGGKYRISKVLGQGGFGITYLAEQTMLGRKVCIKEFFMKELCDREESTTNVTLGTSASNEMVLKYKEKFLKEARNIASLNHPNIVQVLDVFEENNTAYYIMEYFPGGSLSELLKRQGCLSQAVASSYISQVASALSYLHGRRMNHLDVKPANIMLNARGEAVLIDFGLSKQYDAHGEETSATPVGISEGYAPIEQYNQGGVHEFSPETDVYALGATFYKLLTGVTPPKAVSIIEDSFPLQPLRDRGVSEDIIQLIVRVMEPRRKARISDVAVMIAGVASGVTKESTLPIPDDGRDDESTMLLDSQNLAQHNSVSSSSQMENLQPADAVFATQTAAPNSKRKNFIFFIAGIAISCAIMSMVGYFLFGSKGESAGEAEASQSEATAGEISGHEYVDLGLPSGTLWATCNIGAYYAEDFGDYFAWGETEGSADGKKVFSEANYKYSSPEPDPSFPDIMVYKMTKYCNSSYHGVEDNKSELDLADDVAYTKWGDPWRIPSKEQSDELEEYCDWKWTKQNGVMGSLITSKTNGNSIFLPAGGYYREETLDDENKHGFYHTRTLLDVDGDTGPWACHFHVGKGNSSGGDCSRVIGRNIRPVAILKH